MHASTAQTSPGQVVCAVGCTRIALASAGDGGAARNPAANRCIAGWLGRVFVRVAYDAAAVGRRRLALALDTRHRPRRGSV